MRTGRRDRVAETSGLAMTEKTCCRNRRDIQLFQRRRRKLKGFICGTKNRHAIGLKQALPP
jgi:hypothetical protein